MKTRQLKTGQPPPGEQARPHALRKPAAGGSVWPGQRCPAFEARTVALNRGSSCWFCRFANFHLTERRALDVGFCCWPETQTD